MNTDYAYIEALAASEHDRWAHWQRYLHAQCTPQPDGSLVIPASLVQRWKRQAATSYDDLTEAEKDSDRLLAARTLAVVRDVADRLRRQRRKTIESMPDLVEIVRRATVED